MYKQKEVELDSEISGFLNNTKSSHQNVSKYTLHRSSIFGSVKIT